MKLPIALSSALLLAACGQDPVANSSVPEELAALHQELDSKEQTVLRGTGGWLFLAKELRSLSYEKFWGPAAQTSSQATKPELRDPFTAILDFQQQLAAADIELLFLPVPAKALIYMDALPKAKVHVQAGQRFDAAHQAFYALLQERGVPVLDLTDAFLRQRQDAAPSQLYCRQDTHWTSLACEKVAALIHARIRDRQWLAAVPKQEYRVETKSQVLQGDLWKMLQDASLAKESLPMHRVLDAQGQAPADWRESPVLLVGDSHCKVFHSGGDMHAKGAGLADHLAAKLGFPLDVVGVMGSGARPSRVNLLRRRDKLKGKRLVIWCLSQREFTEGLGWGKVPVMR